MPRSQFISAATAKRIIVYCAVAFAIVVALGMLLPPGPTRNTLVMAWAIGFPVGGWMVYRRGEKP